MRASFETPKQRPLRQATEKPCSLQSPYSFAPPSNEGSSGSIDELRLLARTQLERTGGILTAAERTEFLGR
jgi:hypothetical protein